MWPSFKSLFYNQFELLVKSVAATLTCRHTVNPCFRQWAGLLRLKWQKQSVVLFGKLIDGLVSVQLPFTHAAHKRRLHQSQTSGFLRSSWDKCFQLQPALLYVCMKVARWRIALTTEVPELGQRSVRPSLSVKCVRKEVPWPLPQQLSWNAQTTHRPSAVFKTLISATKMCNPVPLKRPVNVTVFTTTVHGDI